MASGEAELLYEAVLHIRTRLVASSGGGGEEDGKVRWDSHPGGCDHSCRAPPLMSVSCGGGGGGLSGDAYPARRPCSL